MTHRIRYSDRALNDLERATDWWASNRSRDEAARWLPAIEDAIATLTIDPERFPEPDEHGLQGHGLRQLNFGLGPRSSHRVIYRVVGHEVLIVHMRSAARDRLTLADFDTTDFDT